MRFLKAIMMLIGIAWVISGLVHLSDNPGVSLISIVVGIIILVLSFAGKKKAKKPEESKQ
jgi:hypothetical protein